MTYFAGLCWADSGFRRGTGVALLGDLPADVAGDLVGDFEGESLLDRLRAEVGTCGLWLCDFSAARAGCDGGCFLGEEEFLAV